MFLINFDPVQAICIISLVLVYVTSMRKSNKCAIVDKVESDTILDFKKFDRLQRLLFRRYL